MQVSLEWLGSYLDLSEWTGEALAERMSRTGIEIENVINYGAELSNLVVAEVKTCEPMEDSDHLNITQVDAGEGSLRQIVCGAPNVAAGQKVIVALPGAVLPGGFEIKESKLRGVDSNGMICSLDELGLPDNVVPKAYADGIYVLDADAPIGADAIDYLKLDDPILELDLTPNRADALSVRGVAHEVGAITGQQPHFETDFPMPMTETSDLLDAVELAIESEEIAPRFQMRVIRDITVKESPDWLQFRLMKSGMRPLNNVVDLTNYFLLLYGQPMHAYDYDTLDSKIIGVAPAAEGQVFTTLDGVDRTLSAEDILILSGDEAIGLAGVMGGLDSEVTDQTRNVLLETAVFNPQNVRGTSKKFALRSESSIRYEKGINLATVAESGQAAAGLIAALGEGQVEAGVVEVDATEVEDVSVTVQAGHIEERLGFTLSQAELQEIFDRLGFAVSFADEALTVYIPPRRWDISIEADVLEEIARIYGYDEVPTSIPALAGEPAQLTDQQALGRTTRNLSESMGLNEVITYVLTSQEHAQYIATDVTKFVNLAMPMSEERTVLRQSMFPALMEVAQYNKARQNKGLAFYELGRVFIGQGAKNQPLELERYGILLSGEKQAKTWLEPASTYDFFDLKGMIETYLKALRLQAEITFKQTNRIDAMHPGRTADIYADNERLGFLGQVHPTVCRDFDLDDATFFAELDMDLLINLPRKEKIQRAIPKFPSTSRDLALLVDAEQSHGSLVEIIEQNGGEYLRNVRLFDHYAGENIEVGKQSLAYHLTFLNPEETLTDKAVDAIMVQITEALKNVPGLEIR
ncbi:phenylalanine--tRNA ligase subunit beta [Suicoccus acidiformans]|uniref:Phenylalanine--tRNA ligase beta subunit n=1 Tax=Suicoccus acidiformans TaxID=2036206 RepID=A0A347WJS8_9LACT|nr:phenylalanine--tRNA ligase subunit beta [Suicoccus acidiformans]AXY25335.1 phenylalanine--tRNA ligase subunit beta [Suicoccus acidiformans]